MRCAICRNAAPLKSSRRETGDLVAHPHKYAIFDRIKPIQKSPQWISFSGAWYEFSESTIGDGVVMAESRLTMTAQPKVEITSYFFFSRRILRNFLVRRPEFLRCHSQDMSWIFLPCTYLCMSVPLVPISE